MRRVRYLLVLAWLVGVPLGFHAFGTAVLLVAAVLAAPFAVREVRLGWRVGALRAATRRIPLTDARVVLRSVTQPD